jgi:hypothetical protein
MDAVEVEEEEICPECLKEWHCLKCACCDDWFV